VIHIQGFGYQVPDSVSPGATVGVMNMDGEAHSVTADDGAAFDAQVTGAATGSLTAPTEPGSYPFHCSYHSTMHGVLVVK
jgi:plastocyanin